MGRPRTIDLIGQTFGNLTVIKHDSERVRLKRRPFWMCQCKCGNITSVRGESLRNGTTKSCGCQKLQIIPGPSNTNFKGYGEIPLTLWSQIRDRSKIINVPIDISIEYLWDLFIQQNRKCSLSGKELYFGSHQSNGLTSRGTASLDRIDSSKGYIKGNVQWVHKDVNWMKGDYDQSYFIEICKDISTLDKNKNCDTII